MSWFLLLPLPHSSSCERHPYVQRKKLLRLLCGGFLFFSGRTSSIKKQFSIRPYLVIRSRNWFLVVEPNWVGIENCQYGLVSFDVERVNQFPNPSRMNPKKPQASKIDVTAGFFLFSRETKSFLGKVHFSPTMLSNQLRRFFSCCCFGRGGGICVFSRERKLLVWGLVTFYDEWELKKLQI